MGQGGLFWIFFTLLKRRKVQLVGAQASVTDRGGQMSYDVMWTTGGPVSQRDVPHSMFSIVSIIAVSIIIVSIIIVSIIIVSIITMITTGGSLSQRHTVRPLIIIAIIIVIMMITPS